MCLLDTGPAVQYQRTTDGLAEAGRNAWSTAQRTRARALNTPNALMGLFGKGRTPYRDRSNHSHHDEWGRNGADEDMRHQLLPSRCVMLRAATRLTRKAWTMSQSGSGVLCMRPAWATCRAAGKHSWPLHLDAAELICAQP